MAVVRLDASTQPDLFIPDGADPDRDPPAGSPRWWLKVLGCRLDAEQPKIRRADRYYDGNHDLKFATEKFRESFGKLFGTFSDNWCRIVVDATVERLTLIGFRFGDDERADGAAWDIWQANDLDEASKMAHTESIKLSRAAIIVDKPALGDEYPQITVEHPSQVYVACDPANPRRRRAAIKRWVDELDGFAYANVYLPDRAYRFRSTRPYDPARPIRWSEGYGSTPFEALSPVPGVVPVIPLLNNPGMLKGGRSDLDPAIPLNDAINKLALDLLIASEFGAYPQKIMAGIEVPTDPLTGRPMSGLFESGASRLMTVAAKDGVQWGQFAATDLGNYTKAIEMFVQHLAAQTRTPPHYLMGQVVNASGDALKAAETGLSMRAKAKTGHFAGPWEEAMRLAFLISGDETRGRAFGLESIWASTECRSEGEKLDAAVKMRSLGVPLEACWEYIDATPAQIERWKNLAGLPDRPPAGATTANVPPVIGGPAAPDAAPTGA